MPNFDDLSLNSRSTPQPVKPARPGSGFWPIIIVVILGLSVGVLYFVFRGKTPPAGVAQTAVDVPRPPARHAAEPGDAIDLPPLDQTDAIVRTLVGKLSSHPAVAAWLTTNGLIKNLTLVIANIADGETPAKHLAPLRPSGSFATKTSRGLIWIDPASYHRYDGIAAATDGLDARGVAHFYATIKPRIDDAYHDLAGSDPNFDKTLERAIVVLLRTPVVDDDVQLQSTSKVTYAFAKPEFQDLSAAQRQFLRMGPQNVRLVKAKLREVAGFLGIPDSALPPPDGASRGR